MTYVDGKRLLRNVLVPIVQWIVCCIPRLRYVSEFLFDSSSAAADSGRAKLKHAEASGSGTTVGGGIPEQNTTMNTQTGREKHGERLRAIVYDCAAEIGC